MVAQRPDFRSAAARSKGCHKAGTVISIVTGMVAAKAGEAHAADYGPLG